MRSAASAANSRAAAPILVTLALAALSGCSLLRNPQFPGAPYPHSRYITGVSWDFSTVGSQRRAHGSDLWPCTWAADSNLYCAWGDGGGFDGDNDNIGRVSLGFARIEGVPTVEDPGSFSGKNVWGDAPRYAENQATVGGKVWTMISVDGTLYAYGHLWTAANSADPVHKGSEGPLSTLLWSSDLGKSWQLAPWSSPQLGSFLNFGQNNAGAPDSFVYIYYSRPHDSADVFLKRVPASKLREDPTSSGAYEYLTGTRWRGRPRRWSTKESDARPIFSDPKGADLTVIYDAPLGRYLATVAHNPGGQLETASAGQVGLFEAPEPWGPWSTVGYYDHWGDLGSESRGDFLGLVLPTKWISADGRTLWAIFSALGQYDSFNFVRATLSVAGPGSH
ncbi:MAG TPA: DUF4185 domain-containing protein [Steroidobacteraceae bacterium]|nr:DUF4185 domain-containing protein [Steroidobacteraceae bacterium]